VRTLVPEPSTATLLALGLLGLGTVTAGGRAARFRRRSCAWPRRRERRLSGRMENLFIFYPPFFHGVAFVYVVWSAPQFG
jgi:hypothetical protein